MVIAAAVLRPGNSALMRGDRCIHSQISLSQ